jgi:hypothetical protein
MCRFYDGGSSVLRHIVGVRIDDDGNITQVLVGTYFLPVFLWHQKQDIRFMKVHFRLQGTAKPGTEPVAGGLFPPATGGGEEEVPPCRDCNFCDYQLATGVAFALLSQSDPANHTI